MLKNDIANIVSTAEHIKVSTKPLISETILKIFRPYMDVKCWCFCNNEKIPVQYNDPSKLLAWKKNPEKGIVTLTDLLKCDKQHTGFGIILSLDNNICCLDFDHFLENGKPAFNNNIDTFAEMCPTYIEVSSSGKGLHAFYTINKNVQNVSEFGINIKKFKINIPDGDINKLREEKKYPDGKFYNNRFIKLTGDVYNNNNYLMMEFDQCGYNALINAISIENKTPVFKSNYQSSLNGSYLDWDTILTNAGILHIKADQYIDHVSPKSNKYVIEAWKIECPNKQNHQHTRENDPSANLAILCKYADGTSSCTCNHDSCKPESRPNLLQKLWYIIKKPSIDDGDRILKELGVI